jgi:hypothetical protein
MKPYDSIEDEEYVRVYRSCGTCFCIEIGKVFTAAHHVPR